jgi:hypothetical protein
MLKSGKDLVYDSQLNGELAVKGGQLTVLQQKHNQIKIFTPFINFMSIMLEKWPGKAPVYLKYWYTENCKKVNYDLLQAESGWFP